MRLRRQDAIIASTIAAVAIGLGLAIAGVSGAIAQSRSDSAHAAVAAIGTDVPVDIDLEAIEVDAEATDVRLVGEQAGATYLVSTSGDGDICLIMDHANGSSASACTPVEVFEAAGLGLATSGTDSTRTEAHMVPADIDLSSLAHGWEASGSLILPAADGSARSVAAASGDILQTEGFELNRLTVIP